MNALKRIRLQRRNEKRQEAQAFSTTEVANALGICRQSYVNLEEDPENISMKQARKLAEYLNCSVEEIFLEE